MMYVSCRLADETQTATIILHFVSITILAIFVFEVSVVEFSLTLTVAYLPHGLGFLCSHRGSNLIFHAHCLLSKKLVAALIVTEEGGAETIADNNSKTIQYIFPPGDYFSSIFPQHVKKKHIQPSQ